MPAPLTGLKVIELARILAGPWVGQTLADLGADVIKVESPEGDDTRRWGPPFIDDGGEQSAAYFHACNRGKRSVVVDFSSEAGRATIIDLVRTADVLVENFKVGGLAKHGLDYESLRAVNPRLIYCSITGFGQTGPYAPRPGYDSLIQAMGGVMSLTGEPDGMPQKVGVPVADLFAGLYGCIGILAALRHRDATGQGTNIGQQIDIGMLDTHVAWLANQGMNYLATGENPARLGNQHPNIVPYQVFPTEDGHIVLSIGNDPTFKRFCEAFALTHLLEDERFATNAARVRNRQLVTDTLTPVMQQHRTTWWVDRLEALKIGCGPINKLSEVFADPHVIARQMVQEMSHGSGHTVKVIANPVRLSDTPPDYRLPPPLLGEHTDAVLSEQLGLDATARAALREKGII
jgi:crotonobetainyl-CoA:carnitine CoA-transferase CaiB-like acyl-CoA transferase